MIITELNNETETIWLANHALTGPLQSEICSSCETTFHRQMKVIGSSSPTVLEIEIPCVGATVRGDKAGDLEED